MSSPIFWVSLCVGGIALAAISYGFQIGQDDGESRPLNVKGLVRDTLLGIIFTAMAWTFIPDYMQTLTSSVSSTISSTATAAAAVKSEGGGSISNDIDVQVGPPRF
jgi:Na+-driven multidrug efflux pump